MPPSTRKRLGDRESRRAATRDKLRLALEALHSQGLRFTEISVDKLCVAADLTRTTFYAYFEDKVDLLLAWLEYLRLDVGDAPDAWTTRSTRPNRAELREHVADALNRYRPHAAILAAARDSALFERRADTAYRALVRQSIDDLRRHIEFGQRNGWIEPTLPATEIATWLASMVHRSLSTSPPLDGDAYNDRLDDHTDIFWNTLYRPVAANR
jgi:TetR/AcrR family transcriptional regulator, ethionamide resistance regulator